MRNSHLAVYLNDHLAGATAALALLDELEHVDGFEDWASRLKAEIAADRDQLRSLMRSLGAPESSIRRAAAWVTEKLAELKTRLDDRSGGALQRLELIEALALGIDGKRALWTALQAVAGDDEALDGLQRPDYANLIQRATDQRHAVEMRRLQAAASAFTESKRAVR